MCKMFLFMWLCLSAFSLAAFEGDFLESQVLVQVYDLHNACILGVEEGIYLGIYDYYTCNQCGRSYQSQPSKCGTCGNTSFTRHEQSPGED
jgi:hypothetical protein